jgi:heat shock protein HspQ
MTSSKSPAFTVGQRIHHRLFEYRGVIVDVDPVFAGTDDWYEQVARTRPPRDEPWYHVLVHDAEHTTYVAQRNLEPDSSGAEIRHPLLSRFFEELRDGLYVPRGGVN